MIGRSVWSRRFRAKWTRRVLAIFIGDCPQMLEEQPTQVTRAEPDTLGKCLNIADIERTLGDQFKRARDHR